MMGEILAALGLASTEDQVVRDATIKKVIVDSKEKTLEITLDHKLGMDLNSLDSIETILRQKLGIQSKIRFVYDKPLISGENPQNIHSWWPDFIKKSQSKLGLWAKLLESARPRSVGGLIEIEVPRGPLLGEMEKQNVAGLLADLIETRLGQKLGVQFLGSDELKAPTLVLADTSKKRDKTKETSPAWKLLWGREMPQNAVSVAKVKSETNHVVIEGELFQPVVRPAGPRRIFLFGITDFKKSLRVKAMEETRGQPDKAFTRMIAALKPRSWVRVEGRVVRDYRYEKGDLVLMVDAVALGSRPIRKDTAVKKRVELHAHSRMSRMDGMTRLEDYVERAHAWGHSAVAITDHGIVQAFPEIYSEAKKRGIKVLFGMEGYLVPEFRPQKGSPRPFHIIVIAKNLVGLKNLYRLVSLSHIKYFYRHPLMPRAILEEHREGLIIGAGCEQGEVMKAMVAGASSDEIEAIAEFYDYLEIQPQANNQFMIDDGTIKDREALRQINTGVVELGQKLGKPVCATSDFHFLDPEDEVYRSVIHSAMGYAGVERESPLFFKSTDEMLEEFSYLGKERAELVVVEYPNQIADQVEAMSPIPEKFCPAEIPDADEQIANQAWEVAHQRYGEVIPQAIREQIEKELKTIVDHKYSSLFWVAARLVEQSKKKGYVVGSRGSVGSSLIATLCGITEVNPLPPHYYCPDCRELEFSGKAKVGVDLPGAQCPKCKKDYQKDGFDIPFAVFLGFHGEKVPDIDLNFSSEFQPEAHKYVEQIFGEDRCFRAGTISTMQDRLAYGFVKKYMELKGTTESGAEVDRLVAACAGIKKTTGQHPGGMIVVPKDMDIYDFTPIQYPADDRKSNTITTHFDHNSMHDALVKLDILGHDNPTSIKNLSESTGFDSERIPLDDPKVLSLFSGVGALALKEASSDLKVGTLGVPEFGTPFVMDMLEKTKPVTFHELVCICGLAHGTSVWRGNAEEVVAKGVADLSTVISARDDIMLYLIRQGIDGEEAFRIMEGVRKGRSLTPKDEALMKEKKIPSWYINSCNKITYLFPKAHAVAYVLMAFKIAFYKVNYPSAFYADYFSRNLSVINANELCHGETVIRQRLRELAAQEKQNRLTAREESSKGVLQVALEMSHRGLEVLPIDLYRSEESQFRVVEGKIQSPLSALPGIAQKAAKAITRERKLGPFRSFEDLANRCGTNKTVLEALSNHGCLQDLPQTNQVNLF